MITGSTVNEKNADLSSFEQIKYRIKRWLIRKRIAIIKKLDKLKYEQESEYENLAVQICCSIIRAEGTTLLGNMKTQERYVRSKDDDIYVVIKYGLIEIINHTYQYTVKISEKGYDKVCRVFDGHQDAERRLMDEQIRSNITHSLQTIYNNIKIKNYEYKKNYTIS